MLPAPVPAVSSERRIMVSSRAIEKFYEVAPGRDKYMLEQMYVEMGERQGSRAR